MLGPLARRLALTAVLGLLAAGPASAGIHSRAEASLLQEMNRVRQAHGLVSLKGDARLRKAARAHSADMIRRGYFAHGDLASRMRRFGVRASFAGENLAWGIGARSHARSIVAEWLASPTHRANLLRPGFRRVGLGRVVGTFSGYAGAAVVTADFAGR